MAAKEDSTEPFQVPESRGGMTVGRLRQIEEAEMAGAPLDLTEEERAEVDEARASIRKAVAGVGSGVKIDFAKMISSLNGITSGIDGITTQRRSKAEMIRHAMPHPSYMRDLGHINLDGIAEAKRAEHEREELNSANIQTTAEVMKEMLAAMQAEAQQSTARDSEARTSARRNFWIGLSSMILAALAVVTPFIIEAIKGWK
jgi:hypothetical protein